MNITEFSAEIGVDKKQLDNFEKGQYVHDISKKVSEHYKEKNDMKEIKIIREFLFRKIKGIHIENDYVLFDELRTFLSGQTNKCTDELDKIFENRSYKSFYVTYSGKANALIGFKSFFERALALSCTDKSIISCDKSKLAEINMYDDIINTLKDIGKKMPVGSFEFVDSVEKHDKSIALSASTKNHLFFQIFTTSIGKSHLEVKAVLYFDSIKANRHFNSLLLNKDSVAFADTEVSNTTRLSYILDLLCMDSSSLSKALFIDKTLISKWRSGERKLKHYNMSALTLAEYIYQTKKNDRLINSLLRAYYLDEYSDEEYTKKFLFRSWIFYNDMYVHNALGKKKKGIVFSKTFAFTGTNGFVNAIDSFYKYCGYIGGSHIIHMVALDGMPLLLNLDLSKFCTAEGIKNKCIFSFRADFNISSVVEYLLGLTNGVHNGNILMENILNKNIIPFVYYDYTYINELKLIIVIKDSIAIEVIQYASSQIITNVHFNKSVVGHLYNMSLSFKRKAAKISAGSPIITSYKQKLNEEVFVVSRKGYDIPSDFYNNSSIKHIIIDETTINIHYKYATDNYKACVISKSDITFSINYILKYNTSYLKIWDNSGNTFLVNDKYIINIFYSISVYQWDLVNNAMIT